MARRTKTIRLAGALLIPVACATLLAQYALDANLQVGGGRVNPAGGYAMPLQRDVYRINRNTGTFQYDQQAAFWGGRPYTARQQEYLMRSGLMDTFARPVETMGPDSGLYTVNRRTGMYRYNQANAFAEKTYSVYQRSAPAPEPEKTIEIGQSTPVYRPAPRTPSYYERSATIDATIPAKGRPGYEQKRSSMGTYAPTGAGSITNLTPQVYRPPFVRVPSDAE